MSARTDEMVERAQTRGVQFDGTCGRLVCMAPGARHFNTSTRRYYCEACARRINEACVDNGDDPICFAVTAEVTP